MVIEKLAFPSISNAYYYVVASVLIPSCVAFNTLHQTQLYIVSDTLYCVNMFLQQPF